MRLTLPLAQVTAIAKQTQFCNELVGERSYSELKGVRAKAIWLEGIVKYVEVAQSKSLALDPREVAFSSLPEPVMAGAIRGSNRGCAWQVLLGKQVERTIEFLKCFWLSSQDDKVDRKKCLQEARARSSQASRCRQCLSLPPWLSR